MYKSTSCFSLFFIATLLVHNCFANETIRKITLQETIELALAKNLNLYLSKQEAEVTKSSTVEAKGKFDYNLTLEGAYRYEELTPIVLGGAEEEKTTVWNVGLSKVFETGTTLSLSWDNSGYDSDSSSLLLDPSYKSGLTLGIQQPLLRGFGNEMQTSQLRASQKQSEAATFQVDNNAADLAATVKKAYWGFVFRWQDIKVQQLSLTLAEKLLEETKEKIKAGKLAEVEIYQPQSEVARLEAQLISAEREIGVSEDELKFLINSDDWATRLEPIDSPTTDNIALDQKEVLENAFRNRADLKAADLMAQAAEINKNSLGDATRPDLTLSGSFGLQGTDERYGDAIDDSFTSPENVWQVGLMYSMPLNNSSAKGAYDRAKAQFTIAKTNKELLKKEIQKNVRTTIRDVELAQKSLEATRKTSIATKKRLEAEQAKFDSGRATTLDVLTAQDAYSQALSQENLTAITYANTIAELDRIQGQITLTSTEK